jgi:putative ABC transport system permease protein
MPKVYSDNPDESKSIISSQALNYSTNNYTYLSGVAPKLSNEVAVTKVAADYFGIGLGDTIYCTIQDKTEKFIVTALFQSMNNMGYSIRFAEEHVLGLQGSTGFLVIGTLEDKTLESQEGIDILRNIFPELDIESSGEYVQSMLGSTVEQFDLFKNLILVLVLGINFLITSLLVRMFITKEVSEIAILKAIGLKDKNIRTWQAARIAIVLIFSIILGTVIANAIGDFLASGVFRMMGASQVSLLIEPLQVFVVYPIIILIVTMFAVLISLGQVRKTQIWEINNQE